MRAALTAAVVVGAAASIAAAPPGTAKRYAIVANNLAYAPGTLTARVGDIVQWTNKDMFLHSVTTPDQTFDVALKPGEATAVVLKRAGVIAYICRFHPGMKGQIVVQP